MQRLIVVKCNKMCKLCIAETHVTKRKKVCL